MKIEATLYCAREADICGKRKSCKTSRKNKGSVKLLKRHYKLIIAILLFLPFIVFVDRVVFAYMQPAAAEAVKNKKSAQVLYGVKCSMCHGINGEGAAMYPKKIAGIAKEEVLFKIKMHKEGEFGEGVKLTADFSTLDDAQKEEIASFVSAMKTK